MISEGSTKWSLASGLTVVPSSNEDNEAVKDAEQNEEESNDFNGDFGDIFG